MPAGAPCSAIAARSGSEATAAAADPYRRRLDELWGRLDERSKRQVLALVEAMV